MGFDHVPKTWSFIFRKNYNADDRSIVSFLKEVIMMYKFAKPFGKGIVIGKRKWNPVRWRDDNIVNYVDDNGVKHKIVLPDGYMEGVNRAMDEALRRMSNNETRYVGNGFTAVTYKQFEALV